ncbi:unnamed protein product [Ilex paraguariensis]|uniref:YTH domain-containing family protein n=1 Tax=Ilex paraguariensis TaxID=185542 RepID=A0ABC8TMK2_9AQUA
MYHEGKVKTSTFSFMYPTNSLILAMNVGERTLAPDKLMEQPISPKDGRIISANPSPGAAIRRNSKNVTDQPEVLITSAALTTVYPFNTYSPQEQTFSYGGYDNSRGYLGELSNYINANNMQVVPPVMYNDNSSLLFHSGYGFDTQMAYGQFSPIASLPPLIVDGQLYSPHQIPVSPPYFPQPLSPGMPHITSSLSVSPTELTTPGNSGQEGISGNVLYGTRSRYVSHFGSGEQLSNQSSLLDIGSYISPLTSAALYPQPVGILGPYERNIAQFSQQQTPFYGYGLASSSSTRRYPQGGSYRSSNYGSGPISHWEAGHLNRHTLDKGGIRERDRDSTSISTDTHDIARDHNRGPRASKPKGKSTNEENSSHVRKAGAFTSVVHFDLINRSDFLTEYDNAKFFVIKSFSEDNVHKSIKYSVWASTPLGNRKLHAAYCEAKMKSNCPVFLLFSVNASGQFCGVAEMVGPVDFDNDADYWQQDRWSGQFPVQWHIIKDVPNSQFRHILLENNENKPVTHSRDSQEVKLGHGIDMLKIFKDYDAETSILDDFNFYDEREKAVQGKKVRQRVHLLTKNDSVEDASIKQLSDNLSEALQLEDGKDVPKTG